MRCSPPIDIKFADEAMSLDIGLEAGELELDFSDIVTGDGPYETYEGPYSATPSGSQQTLLTDGKLMTGNVIVDPIPSNYGLITWDGYTLTVS